MALPKVEALTRLQQLDRKLLHVFVLGPGQGEGLALALPGSGWVLVDGCKAPRQPSRGTYPFEHLLERFRRDGDDVLLMVLTHPHSDHVAGFADLLESHTPRRVAVTGTADEVRRTLAREAETCERHRVERTTGQALVAASVLTALRAINTWAETHRDGLMALHDGARLWETANASIRARAPHQTLLQHWSDDGEMGEIMATRANALSAVLEVVFGGTRLVLGGDLPVRDKHGIVPTGWGRVLDSHGHLRSHAGFKVPHHGSKDALHPVMMRPCPQARAWLLTPFNSSSLPRLDEDDGLDMLLGGQSPVMLTAPSVSVKLHQAHRSGRVTPSHLAALTAARASPRFDSSDSTYRVDRTLGPLDALWCVAFNEDGPVARWRGEAALEVHAP